jgi:hypothetical protein
MLGGSIRHAGGRPIERHLRERNRLDPLRQPEFLLIVGCLVQIKRSLAMSN